MSQDHGNQPEPPEYTGQLDQWQPVVHEQGDATGGVIPYKNGQALAAYYLGIFSMNPSVGSVHAWIGIIMGGIFTIIWGGLTMLLLIGNTVGM